MWSAQAPVTRWWFNACLHWMRFISWWGTVCRVKECWIVYKSEYSRDTGMGAVTGSKDITEDI
jgi:hypothetical protein